MIDQVVLIIGITILVMLSPGPDMIIVLRNTVVEGRVAGLKTSLGVLTGNLVHIGYCLLGIGWLISHSTWAFSLLKYAGAAYLIYLGILSLRAKATPVELSQRESNKTHAWFVQGLLNNVLNPKGTLFYLGVFTMVITPTTTHAVAAVLVVAMMLTSAFFWLFFVYAIDSNRVRQLINGAQNAVNRILGVLLVFLGIRIAMLEHS